MQEQKVTFETATLAKELGFPQTGDSYYSERTRHSFEDRKSDTIIMDEIPARIIKYYPQAYDHEILICTAPTQSLLQKWLREKHRINVESNFLPNIQKFRYLAKPMDIIPKSFKTPKEYHLAVDKYYGKDNHDTYESALEAGLLQALKELKL